MKDKTLNVLVVGAGMYVSGKGTDGYGTILPALYQARKEGLPVEARIAGTNQASVKQLRGKIRELDRMFDCKLPVECYPKGKENDAAAYKKAINDGPVPDCAIIAIPDQLHYEVASYLIKKGVHCLVVKPLAPTMAEVKKLIALQGEYKVYGAVEFHKRFDRSNLKLRDAIKQGKIGDPLYFIVEYSQRKSIPLERFKSWVGGTNIFQYLGIHYVDIISFATGAKPLRVMAVGQNNYLKDHGVDNYDSIQCLTEWQLANGNKFISAILTNWIDPERTSAMSDQKIKVIGTKGRFEADQKDRGICLVSDDGGIEQLNPDFSSFYGTPGTADFSIRGYGIDSIHQFLKDVCSVSLEKTKISSLDQVRPTFKGSIVSTAVIEAANRSLAGNGAWIEIKDL